MIYKAGRLQNRARRSNLHLQKRGGSGQTQFRSLSFQYFVPATVACSANPASVME